MNISETNHDDVTLDFGNHLLRPNFWSPQQYCDFFSAVDHFIKSQLNSQTNGRNHTTTCCLDDSDNANLELISGNQVQSCSSINNATPTFGKFTDRNTESNEIQNFKDYLNKKSAELCIIGDSGDWKVTLGNKHFETLVSKYTNGQKVFKASTYAIKSAKTKAVTALIELIRNKFVHYTDLPEDVLTELKLTGKDWIQDYAQFWITLFPKLAGFVWSEFRHVGRNFLGSYYYPEISNLNNFPLDNYSLLQNINDELDEDLLQGGLTEIFVSDFCNLEFRTMSSNKLSAALKGCFFKTFGVLESSEDELAILRITFDFDEHTHEITHYVKADFPQQLKNTIFVLTHNDETKIFRATNFAFKQTLFSKVILISDVLTDKLRIVQRISKSLQVKPITWNDIKRANGYIKVLQRFVQTKNGTPIQLYQILPNLKFQRNWVLEKLDGKLLLSLLNNEVPALFSKSEGIFPPEVYFARRYRQLYCVNAKDILALATADDAFVGKYDKLFDQDFEIFQNEYKFVSSQLQFVGSEQDFRKLLQSRPALHFPNKNVHFLSYLGNNVCCWRGSRGSSSLFSKYFEFHPIDVIDEKTFLKVVLTNKLTFLTGEAGHGKTVAIKNVYLHAGQATGLFVTAKELASKYQNMTKTKSLIIDILLDYFCENEFERELLTWALKSNEDKLKFLILVDGYDEIDKYSRNTVVDVIETLLLFNCVSVVVALRSYVEHELREKFDAPVYSMELLSKDQQTEFLIAHWEHKVKKDKSITWSHYLLKNLVSQFCSFNVIKNNGDILGTPLLCKILADILEDKPDYDLAELENISKLYEWFVFRKIQIYCEKKWKTKGITRSHPFWKPTYDDICKRHTFFALRFVFSDQASHWFEENLKLDASANMDEYILGIGIIESVTSTRFTHQTFAEYFVASFFAQVARGDCNEITSLDSTFQGILWENVFQQTSKDYFNAVALDCVFAEFFNSMLPDCLESDKLQEFVNRVYNNEKQDTSYLLTVMGLRSFDVFVEKGYKRLFCYALKFPFVLEKLFKCALLTNDFEFCEWALGNLPSNFISGLRLDHTRIKGYYLEHS